MILWGNANALETMRKSNPELASQVDDLGHIVRIHNMLYEAKELGLAVPIDCVDVETMQLVYLLRGKLKEREAQRNKSGGKSGSR